MHKLTIARMNAGYSIGGLSEESGVPAETISRIENGITLVPRATTIYRLGKALGVTPSSLFVDEDPPTDGGDKPPDPRSKPETVSRQMASMPPDTGPMTAFALGWAGDGREGLERLERLDEVAKSLTAEDGPSHVTAQVAAWAAVLHRLIELRDAGLASDQEVLDKRTEGHAA